MDILVATIDRNLECSLVQSMIFLPLNHITTTNFETARTNTCNCFIYICALTQIALQKNNTLL